MITCALFGDRDSADDMWKSIETALTVLITVYSVDFFYVGNVGNFDEMAETVLHELCKKYPHVGYNVVLCVDSNEYFSPLEIHKKCLCPVFSLKSSPKEKIEKKIRHWMAKEADYVLVHTKHSDGEVSELRRYAQRKKKMTVSLRCKG